MPRGIRYNIDETELLRLYEEERLSQYEISQQLGISRSTVRNRLTKLLQPAQEEITAARCSGLQTVARGLANKGRFQLTFCANPGPRQPTFAAMSPIRQTARKQSREPTVRATTLTPVLPSTLRHGHTPRETQRQAQRCLSGYPCFLL